MDSGLPTGPVTFTQTPFGVWVGVVAHEILKTAQRPNSPFPFLLCLGLGLGLGLVNNTHSIAMGWGYDGAYNVIKLIVPLESVCCYILIKSTFLVMDHDFFLGCDSGFW